MINLNIKEIKRIIIILGVVSIILILFLSFSLYRNFTGEVVKNYHSYTKAICNETDYCQDYEIKCDGENLINVNPISGAAVQNQENINSEKSNNTNLCPYQ